MSVSSILQLNSMLGGPTFDLLEKLAGEDEPLDHGLAALLVEEYGELLQVPALYPRPKGVDGFPDVLVQTGVARPLHLDVVQAPPLEDVARVDLSAGTGSGEGQRKAPQSVCVCVCLSLSLTHTLSSIEARVLSSSFSRFYSPP